MTILNDIKRNLLQHIDPTIVENLLFEYENVRTKFFLEDPDNTIKHGGRFSELCLAAIKYIKDGNVIDLNSIKFGILFEEFEKMQKTSPEDELLYLAIPRVASSVYTLRSKKKVAHFKLIDPTFIDATYVVTSCDWILASFIFYFYKNDISNEIRQIIRNILKKQIPLVEEFEDGDLLVLEKVDFREEMLLILLRINDRISRPKLRKILNPKYAQLFSTTISNLKNEKLVHENNKGIKITSKGIIEAEEIVSKYKK